MLLTGPDVPRDLATARLPSTSGQNIVTLLRHGDTCNLNGSDVFALKTPPHSYCGPRRAPVMLKIEFLIVKLEI